MPCYLFTYHAYGSWMPDREEGYVRRGVGELPQDFAAARQYREQAGEAAVHFREPEQKLLIAEVLAAAEKQTFTPYFVATDPSHAHVLLGWKDERPWQRLRSGLKQSLSRRLAAEAAQRTWLSEGASRRQVRRQEHFDHLVNAYLPDHRGWKWSPERGLHL